MVSVIRQMALLVSLMFWQGGFMFYGGVVVPVGTTILGSGTEQGFITQAVTNYLNSAGVVCLILWLEHLWHDRQHGVSRIEWLAWGFTTLTLVGLVGIHLQMDRLLNLEFTSVLDRAAFGKYHRIYIGTSTLQWLASLLLLFLAVVRWNRRDSTKS
jgi:hypothetical protein